MRETLLAALVALGACQPAPDNGSGLSTPDAPDPCDGATPPRLLINEILDGNDSIVRDETGAFDDWIELYNADAAAIPLSGWTLTEGSQAFALPTDVTLDPGEHLVIWADGETAQGSLHASFRIKDAEELAILDPSGCEADRVAIEELPDDVVQGRFPSGAAFQSASIYATPGGDNPVDPGLSRDPSDLLFPTDRVIRMDLALPEASYDALAADRDAAVEAAIEVEGITLEPVLLTIKGGIGSERDIWEKAAFRLNLDAFLPGQRLRGLEHITLNNMVQDPSGVHETIAYELMREAGIPAPRVAHVELWMNGEYRGLFLHVETIDDQFLQDWFADPHGNLYEGVYGADVTLGLMDQMDHDEQGLNDVSDRSELARLAELIDQPPSEDLWPEFQARIDVERTTKMLAAEVVTQHWDGYFWYPNNYRIYHEPGADRWTLIPWGTDQTFNWPGGGIYSPNGAIAQWCLAVDSCRSQYNAALVEMADRLLLMDVELQVTELYDRISELYEMDPLREGTPDQMRDEALGTVDACATWPVEVLAQIDP